MDITYDPEKNARNIAERNLPFDAVAEFDFSTARIAVDQRRDYGETRYIAIGYLRKRLHVLVFNETEMGLRVISLRRANRREITHYEHLQNAPDQY